MSVVQSSIGTALAVILISAFHRYFWRLIWWDIDSFSWHTKDDPRLNKIENLRHNRWALVELYKMWLSSSGSFVIWKFICLGSIFAFLFEVVKITLSAKSSWRDLLTVGHLQLLIIVGAFLVGCILNTIRRSRMHQQFMKRIKKLDEKIEEEIQQRREKED